MREVRVQEAVGMTLCHDITEIVRGKTKGARFRKGDVIRLEDIPVLLKLGKEHLYVWEDDARMLHENDAAVILRDLCKNEYMEATAPKEGKIELKATVDGVFEVRADALDAVNDIDDVMIATLAQHYPVKAGAKLAGMRVIPLVIEKAVMEQVQKAAGKEPLLRLLPYQKMKVGVVTTGSEVFHGRIKDTFTPVLDSKLRAFGLRVDEHRLSDDGTEHTRAAIAELLSLGMDMVLCTGGMSVDPDDRTPAAIKATGARVVTYGAPVLPGAMFMLAYHEEGARRVPIMGLPGCVMYSPATIFDIVLPRVIAGSEWTKKEIRQLGIGGLCMECKVCHYPVCPFGK
mgnify:FL=1|nr:molybdopterin-binding protein [uncultured Selenomonas sp.]